MQLMIDTQSESIAALALAIAFLSDIKTLREAEEAVSPGGFELTAVDSPAPIVPAGTSSNVLPFVPPVPAAPAAIIGAPSAVSAASVIPVPLVPTVPAVPAAPTASVVASTAVTPVLPAAAPSADVHDSAGVPWDGRIHQKAKSKKKDETWKLQKGIAPELVTSVIQELVAAGRIRTASPVSLPPTQTDSPAWPLQGNVPTTYEAGGLPIPSVPSVLQVPQAPGIPEVPQAPGIPQVPQAPVSLLASDAPAAPTVGGELRALVNKITALKTSVPPRLTHDEINLLVVQSGAPSLQALQSMPHLIRVVDTMIDAALLMRP